MIYKTEKNAKARFDQEDDCLFKKIHEYNNLRRQKNSSHYGLKVFMLGRICYEKKANTFAAYALLEHDDFFYLIEKDYDKLNINQKKSLANAFRGLLEMKDL